MKPLYLLFIAAIVWTSCDKSIEGPVTPAIPDAVVQAISGKFPQLAVFAITNLQTDGLYAADFHEQNNHYKAIISKNGSLLSLEKEIPQATLPMNGQQYVVHQYPNSSMAYLFAQLDPSNKATFGYFTKIVGSGKNYLISFDTLGARISVEEESDTVWWRYPVHRLEDIPQGIRTAINAAQPLSQFQAASRTVYANGQIHWNVSTHNNENLYSFLFDASGNRINPDKHEDLLGLDIPNIIALQLDEATMNMNFPNSINYLNEHFPGWKFQDALLLYNSPSSDVGFSMTISMQQTIYYIRFDRYGNFTGATRG